MDNGDIKVDEDKKELWSELARFTMPKGRCARNRWIFETETQETV